MPWEWPVGAIFAFLLALITTPAGVSGAVLLLPIQLSVLHVPSPAVTPTNLVFNIAAAPGGLLRFWGEHRGTSPLLRLLIAGTLPGVVAGAIIRIELLSGSRAFMLVAGGIYGIGGGSLLAPILLAAGFSAYEVAPATLAATFLTSIAGIGTYEILQLSHGGTIAPDWALGAWLGAGGFAGSYLGARLQSRIPEAPIRKLLGLIACLIAVRYIQEGVQPTHAPRPAAAAQ